MRGRDFLDLARSLAAGGTETAWRAAVIHAYYALLLECRDALTRWGVPAPPRQGVHAFVRLRYVYAADSDLKRIGRGLEDLGRVRNQANYDLRASPDFSTAAKAQKGCQDAADALALPDAIDADPARRAAAVAALPP